MPDPLAGEGAVLTDRALVRGPDGSGYTTVLTTPATESDHALSRGVEAVLVGARVLGEQLGIFDPKLAPLRRRAAHAIEHLLATVEDVEWQQAFDRASTTVEQHPLDFVSAVVSAFITHTKDQITAIWDMLDQLAAACAAANGWLAAEARSVVDAAFTGKPSDDLIALRAIIVGGRALVGTAADLRGADWATLAGEAVEAVDEVIVDLLEALDATGRARLGESVYAAAGDPGALGESVGVVLSEIATLVGTEALSAAAREGKLAEAAAGLRKTGVVDLLVEAFRKAGRRIGGRISLARVEIAERALLARMNPAQVAEAQRLLGVLYKAAFERLHLRVGIYSELVVEKQAVNRAAFLNELIDAVRTSTRGFDAFDAEAHTAALTDLVLESNHVIPQTLFNDFPEIASRLGQSSPERMTAINLTRGEHTARYARHLERLGVVVDVEEDANITARLGRIVKQLPAGADPKAYFVYQPNKTPLRKLVTYLRDTVYTDGPLRDALAPTFADWLSRLP